MRGDCDQLPRSPVAAGRRRGDPARHSAHEHAVRRADVDLSSRLRADVRGRRRAGRSARHAARISADHDLLVARLREPQPGRGLLDARGEPLPAGRGRGRRVSGGDQGHRRVVSSRERSTAMGLVNAGTAVGAVVAPPAIAAILLVGSWRWVFVACGAGRTALDAVVVARVRTSVAPPAPAATSAPDSRQPWSALLAYRAGVGPRHREVPDRRGVVLLHLLAAEVSLRRARVRREAGRLLRVDAVRGVRRGQSPRRVVLELAAHAGAHGQRGHARSRSASAPR